MRIKNSKGITLIALVITVIVLLILAGISIAMLTGDNGLLTKASTAKTETELKSEEEQVRLAIAAALVNEDVSMDKKTLREELSKIEGLTEVPTDDTYSLPLTVTSNVTKMSYIIEDKGGLEVEEPAVMVSAGETAEKTQKNNYFDETAYATIPAGFTVSNISGEKTVAGGLVIYDIPESEVADVDWSNPTNVQEKYNQFVWIPVNSATFDTKFKRTEGYWNKKLASMISDCGEADATGENSYLKTNKIEEDKSTKDEAIAMYASVKNYGGFYIGRYEAGIEGDTKRVSGAGIADNVVIKKNKYPYNYVGWSNGNTMNVVEGGAVEKSRNMTFDNENIKVNKTDSKSKTSLCYGVQWDAALNFIDPNYITNETAEGKPNCVTEGENASYVANSENKGWYSGVAGNADHKTGIDLTTKTNSPNNIYDMAGNVWEWTMESYRTYYRVVRGGSYGDSGSSLPASYRSNYSPSDADVDNIGFRVTLYL